MTNLITMTNQQESKIEELHEYFSKELMDLKTNPGVSNDFKMWLSIMSPTPEDYVLEFVNKNRTLIAGFMLAPVVFYDEKVVMAISREIPENPVEELLEFCENKPKSILLYGVERMKTTEFKSYDYIHYNQIRFGVLGE